MLRESFYFVDQNKNTGFLNNLGFSLELVLNYKCTTISINATDTTEYLGTKTNLASTILQSTKKS